MKVVGRNVDGENESKMPVSDREAARIKFAGDCFLESQHKDCPRTMFLASSASAFASDEPKEIDNDLTIEG